MRGVVEDRIDNGPCELPLAAHPWMAYAGFIESGDANSSQSVDDIVYDSDR